MEAPFFANETEIRERSAQGTVFQSARNAPVHVAAQ
jgi:hypothetical protein